MDDVEMRIMTITPLVASDWLERCNPRNRARNDRHVARLAKAIANGEWVFNGDSIRFNGDVLLDGQHRLAAVVKANKPIQSLVIRGLPAEVFSTIDRNKVRSNADILSIEGYRNCNALSAAVSWLHRYEIKSFHRSQKTTPSPSEQAALLEKYPSVLAWTSRQNSCKQRLVATSLWIATCTLFGLKDEPMAIDFFDGVHLGFTTGASDPFFMFRERMISNQSNKLKLREIDVAALAIKAWNAKRSGVQIRTLVWRSEGPTAEPFPEIR